MLSDRAGGEDALEAARRAEGISEREFGRILAQKARASLYLDRMVTPMLEPSEAELRSIHKSTSTPFANAPFDTVRPALLALVRVAPAECRAVHVLRERALTH